MSYKSPRDTVTSVHAIGCAKAGLGNSRFFILGILAGAYIAFGGLLAVIIGGGMPGIGAENAGLHKLVFGAVLPVGVMLVIIAGTELFTGNIATCIPSTLSGQTSWKDLGRNWVLSYSGNFVGSLLVGYLRAYATGVLAAEPKHSTNTGIAQASVTQGFIPLFLKAVGCNWIVCLAAWMVVSAEDVAGKIAGIWFPIMAFVAIGFEHSIANMFFIPAGMLYGAQVTWGQFLVTNLVPVTLGNVVSGALFVGVAYWYIYGSREAEKPQERK